MGSRNLTVSPDELELKKMAAAPQSEVIFVAMR
jgi:hypothetical protein